MLAGIALLLLKLLGIGLFYYGMLWLADFLNVTVPDMIKKIFGAICVVWGLYLILLFVGIF